MSDTTRFTPLYIIQMFLDMRYYTKRNIIIPEAFLESDQGLEQKLRKCLKEINRIVDTNAKKNIHALVMCEDILKYRIKAGTIYDDLHRRLFYTGNIATNGYNFESCFKNTNIINRDVVKDLAPSNWYITRGDYIGDSIFDCIFRYILYVKTKHLNIFNEAEIYFLPNRVFYFDSDVGMKRDFIFNY